jgi:hypothetical protein
MAEAKSEKSAADADAKKGEESLAQGPEGDPSGGQDRESRPRLRRNIVFLSGATVVAVAFTFGVVLIVSEAVFQNRNPYSAIVTYLFIPVAIGIGIGLAVLGLVIEWYRRRRKTSVEKPLPVVDLNQGRIRKRVLVGVVAVALFVGVSAVGTYRGFVYTESTEFCGTVCHGVMGPEYTAYQDSPHARVSCVECHIGSGADWYVRSKVSGLRQVYRTVTDSYELPIEVPVRSLRPARETCEHCHWPEVFTGSVERVQWHFWTDQESTPSRYNMLLHVGGTDPATGEARDIHWHTSRDEVVRYWPRDRQRLDIPWIEVEHKDGTTVVYRGEDAPEGRPPEGEIRTMDCIDCHNRPSHQFPPPEELINQALLAGTINRSLPEIKWIAMQAVTAGYDDNQAAVEGIRQALTERYLENGSDADPATVEQAINTAIDAYERTYYPERDLDWRTYPDHIGHRIFPGCFRCHDDQHRSDDGQVIAMDCSQCHDFIFQGHGEEAFGPVVYQTSEWEHPEGDPYMHEGMLCTECHAPAPDDD